MNKEMSDTRAVFQRSVVLTWRSDDERPEVSVEYGWSRPARMRTYRIERVSIAYGWSGGEWQGRPSVVDARQVLKSGGEGVSKKVSAYELRDFLDPLVEEHKPTTTITWSES